MKKLVATAAAAALLGSAAFAGVSLGGDSMKINMGGWGRGVWLTGNGVNSDGDNDIYTSATKSWGGTGPRVGVEVSGESDNIGFLFGYHAEEGSNSEGTSCDYRIWWSPIEQLKVYLGKTPNQFRGDAVYGMWDIYRTGVVDRNGDFSNATKQEEGWTFQGQSSDGAQIYATPIEGLKLSASFNFPLSKDAIDTGAKTIYVDANGNEVSTVVGEYYLDDSGMLVKATKKTVSGSESTNLANVLGRKSKYAAAYDIESVGTVKVGIDTTAARVTDKDGKAKDQNILNVAFDLKAVENLYVSVGAFVPLVQKVGNDVALGNEVNVFAKYNMDSLTINARVGTLIGTAYYKKDGYEKDGGFGFLVGAGVDYKILEGLSFIGEVDYANGIYANRSTADNMDILDFGIGVKKSYSNGNICVAFEGTTNNGNAPVKAYATKEAKDFGWCIPVCFEYYF